MSDAKYQAGTNYQENPPVVTYQAPSPVIAMAVVQPQETLQNVYKITAKGCSIGLIVLGPVSAILTLVFLSFFGVTQKMSDGSGYVWYGMVFAFTIPIIAGVLGIIAFKQPAHWKIASFMVFSIISAIIAIIMALVCISAIFGGTVLSQYRNSGSVPPILLLIGILGAIFYVALAIVSIYCSVLASKQVGCSGCCNQNQHFQGVVHGQVHQFIN